MLPNPPEDTAGGGRSAESLPFNYSAARASCCPCWSQRKALARAPRLGLAGVVKVWFQDRQAACASGSWHHSLGLGHSALGASPALPIRAALGLAVPGQGLELSFSLQSLCYGMEVLALSKFPKPRWGVWGRRGKEGKLTDHRRKPRWLCWPLGPRHPVPPPRCLRHRALHPDQEYTGPCCSLCLECPGPSIHPARLCPSITFSVKPSLTSMGRG